MAENHDTHPSVLSAKDHFGRPVGQDLPIDLSLVRFSKGSTP